MMYRGTYILSLLFRAASCYLLFHFVLSIVPENAFQFVVRDKHVSMPTDNNYPKKPIVMPIVISLSYERLTTCTKVIVYFLYNKSKLNQQFTRLFLLKISRFFQTTNRFRVGVFPFGLKGSAFSPDRHADYFQSSDGPAF